MKELRVMLCGHPIKETVVVRFSSILLSIYAIPFVCSNDEFIQLRLYWDEEWNGKINKIQFVKVEAMGFYFSISIVRLSLQQQQTMQCAMHFWWPTNHFYRTANSKIILIMSAAQNDIISHTFHTFFSYSNFTLHNLVIKRAEFVNCDLSSRLQLKICAQIIQKIVHIADHCVYDNFHYVITQRQYGWHFS